MSREELLAQLSHYISSGMGKHSVKILDDYLSAREAEMLPKIIAALLEPEAVGKIAEAVRLDAIQKVTAPTTLAPMPTSANDVCKCGHIRGWHKNNEGRCLSSCLCGAFTDA